LAGAGWGCFSCGHVGCVEIGRIRIGAGGMQSPLVLGADDPGRHGVPAHELRRVQPSLGSRRHPTASNGSGVSSPAEFSKPNGDIAEVATLVAAVL
jgi:hypothetical protein